MNYLVRIRGRYYFRIRIPKDLHALFRCSEIKKSTHTNSLKNAEVILKAHSYRLERIFTIARGRMMTNDEISLRMREFLSRSLEYFEESHSTYRSLRSG